MATNSTSTTFAWPNAATVCIALVVALAVSALLTPTPSAASTSAASNGWIDTFDRQAVLDHHEASFSGPDPDHGWTGDVSTCAAGTTSAEFRGATIDRVNWFRSMAGLGPVTEDVERSADAQQAALMNSAQGQISHDRAVTAGYACQTPTAINTAWTSNLALGSSGPTAINGYIKDSGGHNASVGHRSWILSANLEQFGIGDVPKIDDNSATNVLLNGDTSDAPAATRDGFIAWPNPGFVPSTSVYTRWSFALPRPTAGLDVAEAEVTMERNDNGGFVQIEAPVIYRGHDNGAPVDVIVWEPRLAFATDESLQTPATDTTYRITISNIVTETGAIVSYSYETTVIGHAEATVEPVAAPEAVAPQPMDPNHAFTHAAHQDFLGRDATPAELTAWSNKIDQGTSRYALVTELTLEAEWTTQIIDTMYEDTLGRSADAGGRAFWIDQLRDGRTVASVAAYFYGSPEYLERHDDNITLWVEDLYVRLLGRTAEDAGLANWITQADVRGEGAVAFELYQSDESARTRVQALYTDLLDRTADASGEGFWAGRLIETGNDLGLAAELASSDEYFKRAAAASN